MASERLVVAPVWAIPVQTWACGDLEIWTSGSGLRGHFNEFGALKFGLHCREKVDTPLGHARSCGLHRCMEHRFASK